MWEVLSFYLPLSYPLPLGWGLRAPDLQIRQPPPPQRCSAIGTRPRSLQSAAERYAALRTHLESALVPTSTAPSLKNLPKTHIRHRASAQGVSSCYSCSLLLPAKTRCEISPCPLSSRFFLAGFLGPLDRSIGDRILGSRSEALGSRILGSKRFS